MKKSLSLILTLVLCLTFVAVCFADDVTPTTAPEKLEKVEKYLYGTEQPGALIARIDNLETDVYGHRTSNSILTRIDNLYSNIEGIPSDGSPSFAAKLNAVEWQFADRLSSGPAKTRVENAETTLNGKTSTEKSLLTRVDNLVAEAFPTGSLVAAPAVLPKDSLIKVKFMQDISSKDNSKGDVIDFIVADNVYVGDTLVLPKGSKGYGTIKKIVPARSFGRDARIDLNFSNVIAVDGSTVPVYVGDLAKQQAKTAAGAAGASIGGMILFGPIGVIGGAFVSGQSVVIPAGTYTFVQVASDCNINGIIQTPGMTTPTDATIPVAAAKPLTNDTKTADPVIATTTVGPETAVNN